MKSIAFAAVIIICAAALRLYGVNWDQHQHLHPDERFLTMVATAAKIPSSFSEYIDPAISTLNPYNLNFGFYVYGTLPITLNKLMVNGTAYDSYQGIAIFGRYMSAVADMGTLILVMCIASLISRKLKISQNLTYVAGFFYGISVLAIQNAHFFTVDSFLAFFITGAFYCSLRFLIQPGFKLVILTALFLGLAMATKISAIYALPLIASFLLLGIIKTVREPKNLLYIIIFALVSYITLRIGDPRMFASSNFLEFKLNPLFLQNIDQLKSFSTLSISFPPSVQWLSKKPILFPLKNIAFFGLGIPYFILMVVGMSSFFASRKKELLLIALWVVGFFAYLGAQPVTTMRYFYPLYPFFAIMAGYGLLMIVKYVPKNMRAIVMTIVLILCVLWPAAFMAIYTRPHSRVAASEWIYKNIPTNSYMLGEYWDDPLPLQLPNTPMVAYTGAQLPVFEQDSPQKTEKLREELAKADYWILSSNRAYDSIMPLPTYYPMTSKLYENLFAGNAGFTKIAEFTSYPTLDFGFMKFEFDDQWSDEAFTVYDHPKVTIFKRSQ